MRFTLFAVIACLLGVTAALSVVSFRRDQSILGLAGLAAATCAGYIALIYAFSD